MTAVLAGTGVGLAWLGAAILALSDARRGLAVGLLIAALGVALATATSGGVAAAAVLALGGLLAAVAGLRRNPRRGWGLLQVPSTPRIVMCVVIGGGALWLALGMIDGPGDSRARAAALIAMAVGAGKLLGERDPRSALSALSLVAIGAGSISSLGTAPVSGALLGAVGAIALSLLPTPAETEVEGG